MPTAQQRCSQRRLTRHEERTGACLSRWSEDFQNEDVREADPVYLHAVASGTHDVGSPRRRAVTVRRFVQRGAWRNDESAHDRLLSESDRSRSIEAGAADENRALVRGHHIPQSFRSEPVVIH